MSKQKMSLIATACTLVISIVLLTAASLAWMTISKAPEVSGLQVTLFTDRAILISRDKNGAPEEFTQSINLSDLFEDLAPLKPISTYDGEYWFLPSYDANGALQSPQYFPLANPDVNMNVSLLDENGKPLTGQALLEAQTNGYYVSCTFWLATELEENVTVTLSVPDYTDDDNNNLEDWETDSTNEHSYKYGSFAIGSYTKDVIENADGSQTIEARPIDNNAQNALRVGFMVNDGASDQKFTIYEPNADQRSLINSQATGDVLKPTENNGYVYGYTYDKENYINGNYLPTLPIKATIDSDGKVQGGMPTALPADRLIVQCASTWKDEMLDKVKNASSANPYFPNSGDVESFGQFVKDTGTLGSSDAKKLNNIEQTLASSTQIVTLKARDEDGLNPTKVTMYIWIEGQDPDCWNDIANGAFVLNLEFAAREITEE